MHYYNLVDNMITEWYFLLFFSLVQYHRHFNKNIIVIRVPNFLNLSPSYFILKQKIVCGKDKKLIKVTRM